MGEHKLNLIVGETNDARVNNMWADPIQKKEVYAELNSASAAPVEEGIVGAGTGCQLINVLDRYQSLNRDQTIGK